MLVHCLFAFCVKVCRVMVLTDARGAPYSFVRRVDDRGLCAIAGCWVPDSKEPNDIMREEQDDMLEEQDAKGPGDMIEEPHLQLVRSAMRKFSAIGAATAREKLGC